MQAYESSRCSQEQEAESSEATYSDGEPSAPLSGNLTQLAYLPPDRMTAFSSPSRSGMTFRPLTEDLGAAVLMWCQEASRARTSAWPAKVQESMEPAAACGDTWRASLARFDPATSSWKTAQPSLLEDLGESSVIWPRSGMTAGGQCWELPMSGRRISGIGSGLSPDGIKTFHTPNTNGLDGGSNSQPSPIRGNADAAQGAGGCRNADQAGSRSDGAGVADAAEDEAVADAHSLRQLQPSGPDGEERGWIGDGSDQVRHPDSPRLAQRQGQRGDARQELQTIERADWWQSEPNVGRVAHGVAARVDRLKAIGNGQVPLCAATAWRLLMT